jgi:hypothetical protein
MQRKPKSWERVGVMYNFKTMDSYKTGNGPEQIVLTTDVTTIGLAATRAIINTTPITTVAMSNDVTGDIRNKKIGTASVLAGRILAVMTKIDLSILLEEQEREKESNNLKILYTLSGGVDGDVDFIVDPDSVAISDDYKVVIVVKKISLTA